MKPRYFLFTILLLLSNTLFGQHARFTTSGTIEFEKSVNMHAIIRKLMTVIKDNDAVYSVAFDEYKKSQPQFKKTKSTLTFADNKTLFVPEPASLTSRSFFGQLPMSMQFNTIHTDLITRKRTTQKNAFDEVVLLKDSTRAIKWKITAETREIAGYQCRRANAIIMDSVYVVAFYTDEIPVSGGPESFNGLPGMILGVALPHENVTWFATKVTDTMIPAKSMAIPAKGKPMSPKEYFEKMSAVYGDSPYKPIGMMALSL